MLARVGGAVCEAIADLDVRVLFALGRGVDPAHLGQVPASSEVRDFVSFSEVLPHTSLVICHGGYGTCIVPLAASVPILSMPLFSYDQWDNTEAIADVGAGRQLDSPDQTADTIRDAVVALLADAETTRRARDVAEEMAGHRSCEDVARDLATLVG